MVTDPQAYERALKRLRERIDDNPAYAIEFMARVGYFQIMQKDAEATLERQTPNQITVHELEYQINLLRKPHHPDVPDEMWHVTPGTGFGRTWSATIQKESGTHYHVINFIRPTNNLDDAQKLYLEMVDSKEVTLTMWKREGINLVATHNDGKVYGALGCTDFGIAVALVYLSTKKGVGYTLGEDIYAF